MLTPPCSLTGSPNGSPNGSPVWDYFPSNESSPTGSPLITPKNSPPSSPLTLETLKVAEKALMRLQETSDSSPVSSPDESRKQDVIHRKSRKYKTKSDKVNSDSNLSDIEQESGGSPPKEKSFQNTPPLSKKISRDEGTKAVSPISRRKVTPHEDMKYTKERRGRSMAELFKGTHKPAFESSETDNPYNNLVLSLKEQSHVGKRILQKRPSDLMTILNRKTREDELAVLCYHSITIEGDDDSKPTVIETDAIRKEGLTNKDLYFSLLAAIYSAGYVEGRCKVPIADQVAFLFSESRFTDGYLSLEEIRSRIPAYPLLQALNPVQGGIFEVFQLAMPILFPDLSARNLTHEVNNDGFPRFAFHTKGVGDKSIHVKIPHKDQAIITQSQDYTTTVHVYLKNPEKEDEVDKLSEIERLNRIVQILNLALGKLTIITSFVLEKVSQQKESHLPSMSINVHPCKLLCKTNRAIRKEVVAMEDLDDGVATKDEVLGIFLQAKKDLEDGFKQHLKPGKYTLPNKNIVKCQEVKEKKK